MTALILGSTTWRSRPTGHVWVPLMHANQGGAQGSPVILGSTTCKACVHQTGSNFARRVGPYLRAPHVSHAEHELQDAVPSRDDAAVGNEDGARALLGVRDAPAGAEKGMGGQDGEAITRGVRCARREMWLAANICIGRQEPPLFCTHRSCTHSSCTRPEAAACTSHITPLTCSPNTGCTHANTMPMTIASSSTATII